MEDGAEADAEEQTVGVQNGFHHGQFTGLQAELEEGLDDTDDDAGHPSSGQHAHDAPSNWQLVPGVKQGPPQLPA